MSLCCFAAIMTAASLLIATRAAIELYGVRSGITTQYWFLVFVRWLPDAIPCFGYMWLMWDRPKDPGSTRRLNVQQRNSTSEGACCVGRGTARGGAYVHGNHLCGLLVALVVPW